MTLDEAKNLIEAITVLVSMAVTFIVVKSVYIEVLCKGVGRDVVNACVVFKSVGKYVAMKCVDRG